VKLPVIIISAVAIILGIASAVFMLRPEPVQLQALTWFGPQAKSLPGFELTNHNGETFNNQSLLGKWNLLFFGYTNCPDICPDSLQTLSNTVSQINDREVLEQLQIIFVSIDPARDDLQTLKTYVTYFNPLFMSASAAIEKVKILTEAVGIMHFIDKSADGSFYNVTHSGAIILVDPQGRYSGVFSAPHESAKLAHDLTGIINY
jgi:protein SCO1/2